MGDSPAASRQSRNLCRYACGRVCDRDPFLNNACLLAFFLCRRPFRLTVFCRWRGLRRRQRQRGADQSQQHDSGAGYPNPFAGQRGKYTRAFEAIDPGLRCVRGCSRFSLGLGRLFGRGFLGRLLQKRRSRLPPKGEPGNPMHEFCD